MDSKKVEIFLGLSCRERKQCSCGAFREDSVSRTTPGQTTSGAETVVHSDLSALGCLAGCVLLPTQTLPLRSGPWKWTLETMQALFAPLPNVATLTKSLFSAFCYYFGSIHWLSEDRWLDLACWGYRAYGPWDQHKVRTHWVCALKGQGVKSPWIWLELRQLWVTNTGAENQTRILWKSNVCS